MVFVHSADRRSIGSGDGEAVPEPLTMNGSSPSREVSGGSRGMAAFCERYLSIDAAGGTLRER